MQFTKAQKEALEILASEASHIMLFGGSRSGKTFLLVYCVITRALKAPGSRHAILRFRFNHVKASVVMDTFPKVMSTCYSDIEYKLDKTDWYAEFPNGSQIWFGGLDDKERTEKILGQEHATIYLNECSQIPYSSRNMAVTRLAQLVKQAPVPGLPDRVLLPKMYYDCNPPSQSHWSYKLFIKKIDPETRENLPFASQYKSYRINPKDNAENLPEGYIDTLQALPPRLRQRFLDGVFADDNPNALFNMEMIERYRIENGSAPDFQRVIVAVDPSGADDINNTDNDAVGIIVIGLGTDGNAYLIEDLTVKAGPKVWGTIATTAFERHAADCVVAEDNFGGAMVKHVIQSARPGTNYKAVKASRGKVVRAEPVSVLYEQGKVRHIGRFNELEDELTAFSTAGYTGEHSPNRADALVWGVSELFPALTNTAAREDWEKPVNIQTNWMV